MTCVYSPLAINAKSSHIKKNCSVVTTWGSHFIFLCLLLITISCIWADIKDCMHIYKDAQCNEFCIVSLMGFWILEVFFVEEICCIWVSFGPYAYMKRYELHVPGTREMKDTGSQGTEWMLISSGHFTGILHVYWIPDVSIPVFFLKKKCSKCTKR